jgi:hypothetical protein
LLSKGGCQGLGMAPGEVATAVDTPLPQAQGGAALETASAPKRARTLTFVTGERVDAMDLEGVWHEGVVKEVNTDQGYRVHFLGWSSRWDEWIELASERIQPAYTKVRGVMIMVMMMKRKKMMMMMMMTAGGMIPSMPPLY